jgi:hypothetical protein
MQPVLIPNNTESPERLHIDFAKDGYRASNKWEYVAQMTAWLGRQEAMKRFEAYLGRLASDSVDSDSDSEEDSEEDHNSDTHITTIHPTYSHLDIETIVHDFGASQFLSALQGFLRHSSPPPLKPVLPNHFDHFDAYKALKIWLPDSPASGRFSERTRIRATCVHGGTGCGSADGKAGFDTVLVRTEGGVNQVTRHTVLDGA